LHREDDKPAIESSDGSKKWYKEGKLHREGDKPAVESSNGSNRWYKEGKMMCALEVKELCKKKDLNEMNEIDEKP